MLSVSYIYNKLIYAVRGSNGSYGQKKGTGKNTDPSCA